MTTIYLFITRTQTHTLICIEAQNQTSIDDTHGSDHFPIYFDVNTERNYYSKKSFKLKSVQTNWETFTTVLDNDYTKFYSAGFDNLPANEKYNLLYDTITNALLESTPKKKKMNIRAKNVNPVRGGTRNVKN